MPGTSDALTWDDIAPAGIDTRRDETAHERTGQAAVTRHATGFPLPMANEGERLRVVGLRAGRAADRRLVEMGITVGSEITLVQGGGEGPLLIAVSDMRLGLGRGMAHKVLVAPIGEAAE
ncbi:MAG: hypothetical protein GVY13_06420 [Alphaproteobacteria bacterium]|jgi:ferrous iron transport protein A|nr:hypothetical protein [Alphaproteobacteria bacterium]